MNELIILQSPAIEDLITKEGTLVPRLLSERAIEVAKELVAEARLLTKPTTPAERDHAVNVAARLKGECDDCEEGRERVKKNFWKICQAIDLTKKLHVAPMETERVRINREVGAYNEEQRLKLQREQEERDRQAREIERQRREAELEAERKVEQFRKEQEAFALKQKQAQEALERKGREQTPQAKANALQAQLEAQEREEAAEADRIKKQQEFEAQQRQLEADRFAAAERARQEKASGGSQRTEPVITVTDIHALYAFRRDFVRLELNLTQIKFFIKTEKEKGIEAAIPGVSYIWDSSYSAKAR